MLRRVGPGARNFSPGVADVTRIGSSNRADAPHAAVELLPLVNDVFRKLVAARVGTVASLRTWSATGGGSSVRERPAARLSPVHGSGVTTSTAVTGLSGAAGGSSGQSQSAPSSLSRA